MLNAFDGFKVEKDFGSCGPDVTYNKTIIVKNIQLDPKWDGFQDFASNNQLGGCWSTLIRNTKSPFCRLFGWYCYTNEISEMAKQESEERNKRSLGQSRLIMEGTASDTGDKFLPSLVFNLAESLNVQFTFLGSWDG